jgi:anti-sigma28 factor (negative regulator of flagellin synthesis)
MFPADLPISTLRIFSLNNVRKSWELLDGGKNSKEPRPVGVRLLRGKTGSFASPADSAARVFPKDATTGSRKASPGTSYLRRRAQTGVRMERIAAVRAAIAQGTYYVSAADLAQKLMDRMLSHQPARN